LPTAIDHVLASTGAHMPADQLRHAVSGRLVLALEVTFGLEARREAGR